MKLRATNVLLCDDVRKEDNGKAILIGVYTGDVVVSEPTPLAFSFWINAEPDETKADAIYPFKLEIFDRAGDVKVANVVEMTVPYAEGMSSNSIILRVAMPIDEGSIALSVNNDGEWTKLLQKKLIVGEVPS